MILVLDESWHPVDRAEITRVCELLESFKICKVVSDRIGIELGGVFMGRADATLSIFWSERIMGTDVEPSFDV